MRTLASRHGVRRFQLADNILDMRQLRTVMPALAEAGAPYDLFYEIKANLRREQVAALAAAGVTKVQPGIEALHDGLLALMAKGNTAAINIQLLKHAREVGIHCVWLMLVGFPGEEGRWHHEVAAWLPLVCHLQPPSAVVHIRYDRFSVYQQDPARFGLDLVPYPAYAAVYPSSPERLRDLAYFFRDASGPTYADDTPGVATLKAAVREWQRLFTEPVRPVLCVDDDGEGIDVLDTRPVAVLRRLRLEGLDALVYRGCEPPATPAALRRRLAQDGGASPAAVDAAIARLQALGLVLDLHGRLIALGVPGDAPPLRGREEAPGGWVTEAGLPLDVALDRALAHLRALAADRAR
jgi:magnesium-protoporphyrin IX monomethyl ester (oxidative) cyclase